ncbi:MAG: glycosyltransferase family 39 protein [Anaerolineales bacterium]
MSRAHRPRAFWLATALTLLAAGVCVYGLDHHPLRGDEAFSVRLGSLPLATMFEAMAVSEPNPALQYLFIKYWMEIAGRSEFAVRLPSALAGVLTAALMFRLGSSLAGRRAALVAMLWVALNPFLLWFAQDVRVYAIFTATTTAATWAMWRAARHNRLHQWMAAGALWWLALGFHYFTALSIAVVGAALLLTPLTLRRWRSALITMVVVGLAYLPWAVYVWPLLSGHSKSWIPPVSASEALARTLGSFSAGGAFAGATTLTAWLGGLLLAVLIIGGGWLALRRNRQQAAGTPLENCEAVLLSPTMPARAAWMLAWGPGIPLLLYALSLWRPVFLEQYAIAGLPGVLLLAAVGITDWQRWHSAARLLLVAGFSLLGIVSIMHYRFDPAYRKAPDWRALSAYLTATAREKEIVLINQPDPAFEYYHRAPLPFEEAPPVPWAEGGNEAAEAQVARVRNAYQHVRLLFAPNPVFDPDGFVSRQLEACCEKTRDEFVDAFRVQSFDTPAGSLAARVPLTARFANTLILTGFRIVSAVPRWGVGEPRGWTSPNLGGSPVAGFASAELVAGDTAHLTLFWTTDVAVDVSYTVFVHLVAADGFQLAGADSLPRNGARLTTHWQPGETVIDPHLILIPNDLPPGEYIIEVGLYQLETGERLRAGDADRVRLPQKLRIVRPQN